jgi:ABC-type polysaccharide/polyol phosphate transport system ATPase subunit
MNAIEVSHLVKVFRIRHEQPTSLKSAVLQAFRWGRVRTEMITALNDVSFSVAAGESVAIVGRNGSGKSTLLSILARIYRPTQGTFHVAGRVATLLELGAGFHPEMTGIENIYLNGAILGMKHREVTAKLASIISFAELEQFADTRVKSYSSGMIMRLGFAVAVHVDPDVLLVDEVLAVGDEAFQHKCYHQIEEFQRQGRTILFVSHDLAVVRRVAHRALWLDRGCLRADGPVEEVLGKYLEAVGEGDRPA